MFFEIIYLYKKNSQFYFLNILQFNFVIREIIIHLRHICDKMLLKMYNINAKTPIILKIFYLRKKCEIIQRW